MPVFNLPGFLTKVQLKTSCRTLLALLKSAIRFLSQPAVPLSGIQAN